MAAVVVEGVDGDAEGGGVGGAGLAAVSEFLRTIEELLTGTTGLFHLYKSAHGGRRWKAGVSRTHTLGSLPQGANRMLAVKAGDVSELVEDLPLVGPVRGAIPLCDGLNQFSSGLQTQLPLGCIACY